MMPTSPRTLAVIIVVCGVATTGIAASVDSTPEFVGAENSAVIDLTAAGPTEGGIALQQSSDPVEIEPGETVTGELDGGANFVFDIEAGETATIEYTLAEPENSSMVYTSGVHFRMPDGRKIPDNRLGYGVSSGETRTFTVTANESGQVEMLIDADPRATGTIELALAIEQTGEESDDSTNDGSDDSTNDGSDDSTNDGSDDSTNDGSDDSTNDGSDDSTNDGSDDSTNDGSDDSTNDGSDDSTNDDTVVIEPGETVTGDVSGPTDYVFDIEPGERATIEFTWEASEDSGEDAMAIEAEMPDGRTIPEPGLPPRLIVDSGETVTLDVTTKTAGRAKINFITDIAHAAPVARGTFELSLTIEQTGEIPDEPNDDRSNATSLDPNTTKAAELDDADVDYYTFTLPEYDTEDYPRQVTVPVTVTLDRDDQQGIVALNVDTAPAGQPSDTTTRFVGTSNPASVEFVGTEGKQYYVAVVDVTEGAGTYNLTVQLDESNVSAEPVSPGAGTMSLDEISQAAYGLPFDELSDPTSELVRAVHDNQDSEQKLSKDELAQMRYDMDFEELSEGTQGEITVLYRAQFPDGQG